MERKPRWYEYDGALMQFFRTLGDLVVTNLLFIIGSLPVITLGTSILALTSFYQQRSKKGRQGYTCQAFLHLWKQYLKRGFLLSVILLTMAGIFILDFIFLGKSSLSLSYVLLGVLYVVIVLLGMVIVFLLSVLTDLSLSWKDSIEKALKLCVMHWQCGLAVVVAWILFYLLCGWFLWFMVAILPIFFLIGFSSVAALICQWLEKNVDIEECK